MRIRAAVLLALAAAAASAASGCRGDPEKKALRVYEAAIESRMTEEEGVAARVRDLREDYEAGSATLREQVAHGNEQALPFYRRFREAATAAPAEDPRLAKIHGRLLEYLSRRIAFLEGNAAILKASESEGMARYVATQAPLQGLGKELKAILEKSGGKLDDREAAEAMGVGGLFMEKVYRPFTSGQIPMKDVDAALRGEVLPRLARWAARTEGERGAEGTAGVLARWAKAHLDFYTELAATLPEQQALQEADARSREDWALAEELRGKYLEELRAYRESIR